MGLLFNELAITPQGYNITNSLRFQSASSQYLSRTPATGTNGQTYTFSFWIKLGTLPNNNVILEAGVGGVNRTNINFTSSGSLQFYDVFGSNRAVVTTNAVYRDPSAWYHFVVAIDTTLATAADRVKIYQNGVLQSVTITTQIAQNTVTYINGNYSTRISSLSYSVGNFIDGYMTEVNLIDGQALTPSSFGQTNALTGQWVAKKYTGTYGTNGFYLPFSNGTSTTTLGYDSSGNSNNWTLTNFTRSAGANDCWMRDVPSGNGAPSGTQPSSNYAVMNPLNISGMSITRGNLSVSQTATAQGCRSSFLMTSGQWYWEVTNTTASSFDTIGIVGESISLTSDLTTASLAVAYYAFNGNRYVNGSAASYGATYTTNDVIGVAVDITNNTVTFYKNGASQGTITGLSLSGGSWYATNGNANNGANTKNYNFGQRSFAYTPPSGFKALCTANLPTPIIANGNKHFDATIYSGNDTARSITNAGGFEPGIVWQKNMGINGTKHYIFDSAQGVGKWMSTTDSPTNTYTDANTLTSFNSNGFSLGTGTAFDGLNCSGYQEVAWQWKAGSPVTNTEGTITTTVRANPTAGISIVSYTGNGVASTLGHGLGVAPKFIISRASPITTNFNWLVYHEAAGPTKVLFTYSTAMATVNPNPWNDTAPTSSVYSILVAGGTNAVDTSYIAYCFAEVPGFSKISSYTGNSNPDGTFVYTGFRPRYIMIKRTDDVSDWVIKDTARSDSNVVKQNLYANLTWANTNTDDIDILSNGFKIRHSAATGQLNTSGGTYAYVAFAEAPFNYSNAR